MTDYEIIIVILTFLMLLEAIRKNNGRQNANRRHLALSAALITPLD